jgi:hypothetical protein
VNAWQGLGWGHGKIIDHGDGTAEYIKMAELLPAFRVRIADVTGFSTTRRSLTVTLHVLGNGTALASVEVSLGTPERIEAWFRAHPAFGQVPAERPVEPVRAPAHVQPAPAELGLAGELQKLADLRDSGILTEAEFGMAKARVLGAGGFTENPGASIGPPPSIPRTQAVIQNPGPPVPPPPSVPQTQAAIEQAGYRIEQMKLKLAGVLGEARDLKWHTTWHADRVVFAKGSRRTTVPYRAVDVPALRTTLGLRPS